LKETLRIVDFDLIDRCQWMFTSKENKWRIRRNNKMNSLNLPIGKRN